MKKELFFMCLPVLLIACTPQVQPTPTLQPTKVVVPTVMPTTDNQSAQTMTLEQAMSIAQTSECTQEGKLTNKAIYNDSTNTWWIDLDLKKEGCSPACVVSAETKKAEINWRCTGLIPE